MAPYRDISRVIGRRCLPWPVCSLGKTLLSLPYFILYSKAKLACYSRYLLTSYFCISIPCDEMDIFFALVLERFVGLHTLFNFSFFGNSGWGIDLDYSDIEWLALEMNWDHSVIFKIVSKHYISDSFGNYEDYSIPSKRFLPTVLDIMVIWIKVAHSHPF